MFRALATRYGWTMEAMGRLTPVQADMMLSDGAIDSPVPGIIPFDRMEDAFEFQRKRREANG